MALPLLNTVILLSSGATVTWAHDGFFTEYSRDVSNGLTYTIVYGLFFTAFQKFEYDNATFSINDSVYGSIFYMTTGFHGLHVFVGTVFLIVCLLRHNYGHFAVEHHIGFICAV